MTAAKESVYRALTLRLLANRCDGFPCVDAVVIHFVQELVIFVMVFYNESDLAIMIFFFLKNKIEVLFLHTTDILGSHGSQGLFSS